MKRNSHPDPIELLTLYLEDKLSPEARQDIEVQLLTDPSWQETLDFLKSTAQGLRLNHLMSISDQLKKLEQQLPPVKIKSSEKNPADLGYLASVGAYTSEREAENLAQPAEEEQPVAQGVRYHTLQSQIKHLQQLETQLPPVKVPDTPSKLKHWSRALIAATVLIVAGLFFPWSMLNKYQEFDRRFQPISVPGQHRSSNVQNQHLKHAALEQGLTWYIQGYYKKALREFDRAGLSVQDPQYGKYKIFALLGAHKFKAVKDSLQSIPPDLHNADWYQQALSYLQE